jgi:NAD(P)-dependent dehydrogenase (short-subunit alcohol dehydrogenase family)
MSETPLSPQSVLVTGASTGIGRATVGALVTRGDSVWATVRTDADDDALRAAHPSVRVLRMDVTDAASVRAAGEEVAAAGPLNGLVNNAGVALPGPLEYLPIELLRQQIEVNLIGQLAVTQAMLPALRAAREAGASARIVTIGSIGGRIASPMLGPYHASKFGLVGLTDTLRAELAPSGIDVLLIEPGSIATPIWGRGTAASDRLTEGLPPEASRRYGAQIASARADAAKAAKRGLPPERVADAVVAALTERRPRPRRLVGRDAHLIAVVARMPFGLRYRLTAARR